MEIRNLDTTASTLDTLSAEAAELLGSTTTTDTDAQEDTSFLLRELTRRTDSAAMIIRMVIDGLTADAIGATEAVSILEGVSDILTDLDLLRG